MEQLEVLANFDWQENEQVVGILNHENLRGSDVYSFDFSKEWLQKHPDLVLSRDLELYTGTQYAPAEQGIFSCFSDALPDRWGRKLIDLRFRQQQANKQVRRKLSDWDYLKGVEDNLRMGALRFRNPSTGEYLNTSDANQVPPVLNLNELLEAANEIEKSEYNHVEPEERWVLRLFQPGSSVGGARPKACVTDQNSLYIAKFPSIKDNTNIALWEHFAHVMAKGCGINTAETKLVQTRSGFDILLSKRFDRTDHGKRVHMASSLTMLGLTDGAGQQTGNGYLDIADFIISHGCHVENNLKELYRRIAFNICIGNSDDHFRNHSFLLTKNGWELSPAYDMNPTLSKHQSLLINEYSNEANLDMLYQAHSSYMLDEHCAWSIITDITRSMKYWESTAKQCGIKQKDMEIFVKRFEDGQQWSYANGLRR